MTIEEQFAEIREHLAVAAAIQARHAETVAFHDEWLRQHTLAIAAGIERDKTLGERVDKLVSAIGEICRRIPLPPEAQ